MTRSPCIKPIRKKLLVRKCLAHEPELHEGRVWYRDQSLVVTDIRGTYTHWAEVLAVAEDCELFRQEDVGGFVFLPEWAPRKMTKVSHMVEKGVPVDEFIVSESLFLAENGGKPIIAR